VVTTRGSLVLSLSFFPSLLLSFAFVITRTKWSPPDTGTRYALEPTLIEGPV
jgi:hypothetical protein